MGNYLNCCCCNEPVQHAPSNEPVQHAPPTKEEVIDSLKDVSKTTDLNEFVIIIKQLLEEKKKSHEASTSESAMDDKGSTSESGEKRVMFTSFVKSGAKFLKFVNEHTEKIEAKKDLYSENSRVVADILGQIGQLHWIVAGLAITAYLIEKIDKVSANKAEALELLSNMVDLVTSVSKLRDVIPEEKLKIAVMLVVQGSIMCVSQIYSEKICSFLKTSINSENLKQMSNRLDHLYRDLNLTITIEILMRQSILLPVPKPEYPTHAVGIEKAQCEVIQLLNMRSEDALLVVIYGFGGMGKTTLANAVVATLNLNDYNYARVLLDQENNKDDLKKMQEIILKDAFPSSQASIALRDCSEGRYRLKEAFLRQNKPVFLFIDNALKSQDLEELLPEDLSGLPKRSRVLITTRRLETTDVFLNSGIERSSFAMKTLDEDNALKILCKEPHNLERIKDDKGRILRTCGGVPLALRIVRGHLGKMGYDADREIVDALEKGGDVKEENLSRRLFQFVYDELEEGTQEAFLDICWFFNGWIRRHVEYIVGAEQVKSLEEAALVTPFVDANLPELPSEFVYIGEERLWVHDILSAKGRSMSASTRFTTAQSFSQAAQDEMKLKGIKGIWFKNSPQYVLDVNHLNFMSNSLRILYLGSRTSGQSHMKFKELRYLEVQDDYSDLQPDRESEFELEIDDEDDFSLLPMKVDDLDLLSGYRGPIGPYFLSMKKLPKRVRMIRQTIFPSFLESVSIQNHYVEELKLEGGLIRRFPWLSDLRSLKILSLLNFYEITEFPEQVCELSSLSKLSIHWWPRLKNLPQSIVRLKGLTHLQICYCHKLEELPSSLGELKVLQHLTLLKCPLLKDLPDGLESLKYLDVTGCEYLSVESYENKPDLRIVKG